MYVKAIKSGGIEKSYEYDGMGRVIKYTDPNRNPTTTQYDKLGRVKTVTNPDATYSSYQYIVGTGQNTILYRDENWNKTGTETAFELDGLGNIKAVKQGGKTLKSYHYNTACKIEDEYDGKGTRIHYTYDHYGRVLTREVGNGLYKENYQYKDIFDAHTSQVTKTVEGSPAITMSEYISKYGWLVRDSLWDGSVEHANTYEYDYLGNQVSELTAKDKSKGLAFTNQYRYDFRGNLTGVTNAMNQSFPYGYDLLGGKTAATDPKGNTTHYEYDNMSRLTVTRSPFEGNYETRQENVYDNGGNVKVTKVTANRPGEAEAMRVTNYHYNSRNMLTKASNVVDGVENYVTYEYDSLGQKTKMRTANGSQLTQYEYDNLGRLVKLTDPMNQPETYGYDDNGNMTSKTDRNGATFTYAYDLMNRLVKITAKDKNGVAASQYMEHSYDKNGLMLMEKNENLTVSYAYDNLGRLNKLTESNGFIHSYGYDLAGNRTSYSLAQDGMARLSQTYQYDNLNRLTGMDSNGVREVSYAYDVNGNRESMTYGNGVVTTYSYNKANLVTALTNKKDAATLSSYSYTYYLDGNQSSKKGSTYTGTSPSISYQYDGLGRLSKEVKTSGSNAITHEYQYDLAGNRKAKTIKGIEGYRYRSDITSYVYDINNRLLKESTFFSTTGVTEEADYSYDANGNQISCLKSQLISIEDDDEDDEDMEPGIGGTNNPSEPTILKTELWQYDVFSRVVQYDTGGISAAYSYKPNGYRLSKTINGEKTTHVWDGANMVLDLDGGNGVKDRYIRGINLVQSDRNGYYVYNAHGDVTQLASMAGAVTKNYTFDAFGVESVQGINDTNPFRYCGEYTDFETNMVYLRARYYSPSSGRFLSEDSIKDGLNWYAYCGNNPVGFIDPSGNMSVDQFIGVFMPTYALHSYINAQYSGEVAVIDSIKILYGMYHQIQDALSDGITFKDITDQLIYLAKNSILPFSKEQLADTLYVFEHLYYFDQDYVMSNDEVKGFGVRAGQIGKELMRAAGSTYLWVNAAVNLGKKAGKVVSAVKGAGKLSNVEARQWYLNKEAKIKSMIDTTKPLEQQAQQAFNLRNQFRTQARELMSDRTLAESLYKTDPNMTWDQIVNKYTNKGFSGDSLWQEIINASTRSRTTVNQGLSLE